MASVGNLADIYIYIYKGNSHQPQRCSGVRVQAGPNPTASLFLFLTPSFPLYFPPSLFLPSIFLKITLNILTFSSFLKTKSEKSNTKIQQFFTKKVFVFLWFLNIIVTVKNHFIEKNYYYTYYTCGNTSMPINIVIMLKLANKYWDKTMNLKEYATICTVEGPHRQL